MSTSPNKTIARRYFDEIWNMGDMSAIAKLVSEDAVGHVSGIEIHGQEVLRKRYQAHTAMYSDSLFTVEDLVAEDDKVLVRWSFSGRFTGEFMGISGAGEQITSSGMNLFRIAQGRIAELWVHADDLGELQQLGALPALEATEA